MADPKKFSSLPVATQINQTDSIVILQGGVLKLAPRSLLGTGGGSTDSTGGATNFLSSSDFTVNSANAPGWSNYLESLTRTGANTLSKTGNSEAVFIQFHKNGELTVGKNYKLSAQITRVSGDGTCVVRESQDNVSNPDPNTYSITNGVAFTSSVIFSPGSGDVGLGFIFEGGPGTWKIENLSCLEQ